MTHGRRSLGRGLDALLGGSPGEPAAPAGADQPGPEPAGGAGSPIEVDIDLISANPEQPRTHFDPEQLRELADSIREHGIIQPLVVSRDPQGGFRLIAGERRLQASRLAERRTVPVILREAAADAHLLELALVENIQRADLNPIEEAMAFRRLVDEYGHTQEEVARKVGRSRAAVANSLRLLALEPEIRRSLVAGEITEGHARALLGMSAGPDRLAAWRTVAEKGLTVRETEALVRRLGSDPPGAARPGPAPAVRRDPVFGDLEDRLRRTLATRVSVKPNRGGARITIDCYSREELESVLDTILREEP